MPALPSKVLSQCLKIEKKTFLMNSRFNIINATFHRSTLVLVFFNNNYIPLIYFDKDNLHFFHANTLRVNWAEVLVWVVSQGCLWHHWCLVSEDNQMCLMSENLFHLNPLIKFSLCTIVAEGIQLKIRI